ncbi:MAG TPA: FecR domain-containing protein [Steroidobacteraceae bacterium]|nr:FecR domain-containing protein [Steroidobacteraceae bacterium]
MEERLKLNTQIYEEACEWFVDCRAGDLDDSARQVFHRWLCRSPEHLGAYLEIAAIWDEGLSLDPTGKFDRERLIAEAALNRENVVELSPSRTAETSKRETATPPASSDHGPRPASQRWRFAAMAASVIAALTAALAYWGSHRPPTYTAAVGEERSVTLADGSRVQLDSRSKIVVRYSERERRVELVQGQALFRVAKQAARPFIVEAGDTFVRAVGTEFDVYQKRAGTVVTVVEGRVAVLTAHAAALNHPGAGPVGAGPPSGSNPAFPGTAPGRASNIMVAAGEQLTVTPRVIRMSEHPNIANATAWTSHRLVFESASLADVAEEFNRYNARQLIVADPRLKTFHVSGVFSSTDPASLIRFLRARPEFRLVETETQIRIEKNTP